MPAVFINWVIAVYIILGRMGLPPLPGNTQVESWVAVQASMPSITASSTRTASSPSPPLR